MTTFEEQYYEHDPFWNPDLTPLGREDEGRISAVLNHIPPEIETVADLGCGNGLFGEVARNTRPDLTVIAMDRSRVALRYALSPKALADLTVLPLRHSSIDCAVVLEVLEHLPYPLFEPALDEITRVTRQTIIVTVPNNQHLGKKQTICPACRSRFDPDLHMRSFDSSSLRGLFLSRGFACSQVQYLGRFESFVGVDAMKSVIAQRPGAMGSPLCPVCGTSNPDFLMERAVPVAEVSANEARGFGFIKRIAKRHWPRSIGFRWLLGRFDRVSAG